MRSGSSERDAARAAAGIYVHFPFCVSRCAYCDFPSVAGRDRMVAPYLDALEAEVAACPEDAPLDADSVYLGGGTPSLMSPRQVARVLKAVRSRFRVDPHAEVTLEGNPESLTRERLDGYRAAGVNRMSVGVESLDDAVLRRAGRAHGAEEGAAAVRRAASAGFDRVSLDLIAGLQGEDLAGWGSTVRRAAALGTGHVSVYLLEADKDTPLARARRSGLVDLADDDALARAYETTAEALQGEGLHLYEISNFCRPGHESRHNLKYWSDAAYVGFGAGAHSYFGGARRANVRDLDLYLARVREGRAPVEEEDAWDPARRAAEALVLGLRLARGADLGAIGERYGVDLGRRHAEAWERAEAANLIVREGGLVRLTPRGRLHSNTLFAELI